MRYIPQTNEDKKEMLSSIGASSIDELFADIPEKVRLKGALNLPEALSEISLLKELCSLSKKNQNTFEHTSFLGAGIYNHFAPSIINHIVKRSEFYTAYTPYQPEVSQGTLQAIFEYQTMICNLTGMDIANASMYDAATALAEAVNIAVHQTRRKEVLVSKTVHPHYRQVLKTYGEAADWKIEEIDYDPKTGITKEFSTTAKTACAIIQQPNFFGCIEANMNIAEKIHQAGALYIVSADPISLGLLKPPGAYGADIVVGEGQALGSPQNFGGPCLGIFAVKKALMRFIPGRLAGETVDAEGKKGFVLTLQTREQHIRREKALSNICSNEALAALAACVYLCAMGKQGLKKVAELCLQKSNYLKKKISSPFTSPTFKEFVVKTKKSPTEINKKLLENNIIGGLDLEPYYPELKNHMLFCVTETITKNALDQFISLL